MKVGKGRGSGGRGARKAPAASKPATPRGFDAAILIADLRDALEKANASNRVLRANAELFRSRFEKAIASGAEPSRETGKEASPIWEEIVRAERKLAEISRVIGDLETTSGRLHKTIYLAWLETQATGSPGSVEVATREQYIEHLLSDVGRNNLQTVIGEVRRARAYLESLQPKLASAGNSSVAESLSRIVANFATMGDEHEKALIGARKLAENLAAPNVETASENPSPRRINPFKKKKRQWRSPRLEMARVALEVLKPDKVNAAIRDATLAAGDFRKSIRALLEDPSRGMARRGPKVSIVLPVYNHAHFMEEAIESVLAQTYGNWELIIVDDGSRDDVAPVVSKFSDERRLVLLRQENQKLPAALNNGFHFATGEYLTWTSADNVMLPNQIATLVRALIDNPDAGLVYSDYWAIDDLGSPLGSSPWRSEDRDSDFADLIRLPDKPTIANLHLSQNNFIGASFMYRRDLAGIVGRYAQNMFSGEDYDYWLRMHMAARFAHIAEPLYRYRVHDDTLTARGKSQGQDEIIFRLLAEDKWRLENLLPEPAFTEEKGKLLRPAGQFKPGQLQRLSIHPLSQKLPWRMPDEPLVTDVDVPPRRIDPDIAGEADLLLCRDDLSAAMLRRASWARRARVLRWDGTVDDRVRHAFVQAIAERASAARDHRPGPLPALDASFHPRAVLFLLERWSTGGLENVVIDLANGLAARKIPVTIATAEGPAPQLKGIRSVRFDGNAEAFARFLAVEGIDLISAHHTIFGIAESNRLRIPYVYTMHNSYLWFDEARLKQWSSGLAKAAHIIAVSPQVAQFAIARLGLDPRNISVIPNPIDLAALRDPGPRMIGKGKPFKVVALGSFNRIKLQHVLVSAFKDAYAEFPDMRLSLIGSPFDQTYFDEVSRQVEASPAVAAIEIVPGLPHKEALQRLSAAHVFSLATALEGWSIALMEAIGSGCVCIASEVGGVPMLGSEEGAVITLPSPLGELESITAAEFDAALRSPLEDHRKRLAAALKRARTEYEFLAARVPVSKQRLTKLCGRDEILTDWLRQHVLSGRAARFD